jgi:thymidine phosphorylase
MKPNSQVLYLKQLGINTYKEAVIYIHKNSHICRAEGFEAQTRIEITLNDRMILATLNMVESDLLNLNEAGLSTYAWDLLEAKEGDKIHLAHPRRLHSFGYIRSKIYGNDFKRSELFEIVNDIAAGYLSDIHIATFLTACAGGRLSKRETFDMTEAMIRTGTQLEWSSEMVVDKHCVGGLPGNRTSIIVVPIVAAFGLTIPKTSSRAITSPAGTADTMEVLAPVNLDIVAMRKVVEQEQGCLVWGGSVALSPVDDILISVERVLDLDGEGQLVASILSKKIAAGATHIIIDIPIGSTAKVRTQHMADLLKIYLQTVGKNLGVTVDVIFTDGSQPIGRGIGPALEAKDVLAVLQCDKNAPQDLRNRALILAGRVIEFAPNVAKGTGKTIAAQLLDSGEALRKFQAICEAQGGMFEPPVAAYTHVVESKKVGEITAIDNRHLARVAKLAGAPNSKAAGVELLVSLGTWAEKKQPLFVVHSETPGELKYALNFFKEESEIFHIEQL